MFYIINLKTRMFVRNFPVEKNVEKQKESLEKLLLRIAPDQFPNDVLSLVLVDEDDGKTIWESPVIIGPKGREGVIQEPEKVDTKILVRANRKSKFDAMNKYTAEIKKWNKQMNFSFYQLDQEYIMRKKALMDKFQKEHAEILGVFLEENEEAFKGMEAGIVRKKGQIQQPGYDRNGEWRA